MRNQENSTNLWNFLKFLKSSLKNEFDIKYIRVKGIDGNSMNKNEEVQKILSPKSSLIGQQFVCKEFNQNWIYDGSIEKSFPGLSLNGHYGTKGLTLSNLKNI